MTKNFGIWKWEKDGKSFRIARTEDNVGVAYVLPCGSESEETARLIAAAPDLLVACKALLLAAAFSGFGNERLLENARMAIDRAITNAEGKK